MLVVSGAIIKLCSSQKRRSGGKIHFLLIWVWRKSVFLCGILVVLLVVMWPSHGFMRSFMWIREYTHIKYKWSTQREEKHYCCHYFSVLHGTACYLRGCRFVFRSGRKSEVQFKVTVGCCVWTMCQSNKSEWDKFSWLCWHFQMHCGGGMNVALQPAQMLLSWPHFSAVSVCSSPWGNHRSSVLHSVWGIMGFEWTFLVTKETQLSR